MELKNWHIKYDFNYMSMCMEKTKKCSKMAIIIISDGIISDFFLFLNSIVLYMPISDNTPDIKTLRLLIFSTISENDKNNINLTD